MSYLEINTSPAEIRSLGDRIGLNGTDMAALADTANDAHDLIVGKDMSVFGNDDLGNQFKPSYRGEPSSSGEEGFDPTNAGQFFASMKQIGGELGELGGGLRSAIDGQIDTELDNVAALNKIDPPA
ncbi:hypothetical protein GCM10027445_49010 [Amycolatopsis endophytica]|uniref:Uncharacterized protein n=1 Tax=Amycolatopsis endophytica TaxID=860233 RepID=A0A853BFW7_9PSEU|nr:hypothetical protein [Amycolatopsis endophytica]NYI93416.1 hypothetical protein [Amycolatopsis endophytica]